jgi:molecular chaperone GrpE
VLADFRAWLQEAAAAPPEDDEPAPAGPLDLATLLGQFVALRHEVNLQTRAARGQQEQTADALRQLSQALDLLRQRQQELDAIRSAASDEALRPFLKTLLDLHDALSLAEREVRRVEGILAAPQTPSAPAPTEVQLPLLARLFGGRALRRLLAEGAAYRRENEQAADRFRQLVRSILTGYTMSVQRLERALQQYGLEPIPCVGQPFDPEVMEAVEVVPESGRLAAEVVAEVRRGYLWHGRVFRYAQVKVARPG